MAHFTHLHLDVLGNGEIAVYDIGVMPEEGRYLTYYIMDSSTWSICQTRRPTVFASLDLDVQFGGMNRVLRRGLDMLSDNEDGSLLFAIRSSTRFTDGYHFILASLVFIAGVSFGAPLEGADPVELMIQACDVGALPESIHPIARAAVLRHNSADAAKFENVRRARRLLMECLSPDQLAEFEVDELFHMVGADGNLYRIEKGYGHNVYRLDPDGTPVAEYCIINTEAIPTFDLMLAQKLLLETNPNEFEAISNIRLLNRLRL